MEKRRGGLDYGSAATGVMNRIVTIQPDRNRSLRDEGSISVGRCGPICSVANSGAFAGAGLTPESPPAWPSP